MLNNVLMFLFITGYDESRTPWLEVPKADTKDVIDAQTDVMTSL